jgi:DNA-directed RNA polymerase subunit M/transcription elongation factor TFIIS
MSFTIKCNKCGYEQEFKNMDYKIQDNVSVVPYVMGTFQGDVVDSIDIQCENVKCDNDIALKV